MALETQKQAAKFAIDAKAGEVRSKYITTYPGQEITYIKKEIDAEAFKLAGYPEVDIADYPWIQAEAIAMDDSGQQVTDNILMNRDMWIIVGTAVEQQRITGKMLVDQQLSIEGITLAVSDTMAALDII